MSNEQYAYTLTLLQKVWVLILIAIYFAGFMNEYHFPGVREEALKGEDILWNAQRVLFFGLMGVGFLIDIVRMREDRKKAFIFLLLSLIMGGFSGLVSAIQFKLIAFLFGWLQMGDGIPGLDSGG